jgi:hypothetical protein
MHAQRRVAWFSPHRVSDRATISGNENYNVSFAGDMKFIAQSR